MAWEQDEGASAADADWYLRGVAPCWSVRGRKAAAADEEHRTEP